MTQNVLITGGAGFIGSKLAERLASENYRVTVYDCLMYGRQFGEHVEKISNNIELIDGDVRDEKKLSKLFGQKKFDIVFHLADIVGIYPCDERKKESYDIATEGTENIAKLCRKYGSKLISNSTSSIYGDFPEVECFDEDFKIDPDRIKDQYSKNSFQKEQIIKEIIPDSVILRPATLAGKSFRDRYDLFPNSIVLSKIVGNLKLYYPQNMRILIGIDDLIDAYVNIIKSELVPGFYNISHYSMPKLELANTIGRIMDNVSRDYPKDWIKVEREETKDKRNLRILTDKARDIYAIEPQKTLEETMKPLIKFTDENLKDLINNRLKGVINIRWETFKEIYGFKF